MVRSAILALLLWPTTILAQITTYACATPLTQAGDVSLQLFLKNGQTVFRQGEIIALTAEYTPLAKKYYLDTRNYDRSGRLDGMEIFCIDPDFSQGVANKTIEVLKHRSLWQYSRDPKSLLTEHQ